MKKWNTFRFYIFGDKLYLGAKKAGKRKGSLSLGAAEWAVFFVHLWKGVGYERGQGFVDGAVLAAGRRGEEKGGCDNFVVNAAYSRARDSRVSS